MSLQSRKLRIDFQKLVNQQQYDSNDILLIYQWLIQTGKICNKQYGWYRYGLHQSFHGYSGNNVPDRVTPLFSDWKQHLHNGFVNLLCKTNQPEVVKNFLKENNILIGKVRIITIREAITNRNYFKSKAGEHWCSVQDKLHHITTGYKGLELKKELFHPDYTDRIKPRILDNIYFGTNGEKWFVAFTFSFECFDYRPGWDYTIYQEENESLPDYFDRVIEVLDSLVIDTDNCDNCPYWGESSRGDYLRHGYRGGCRQQYDECKKTGVVKYKWGSENGKVCDNATYHSIVFPYYRTRK